MSLSQKNPSSTWEPLPVDPEGKCHAWVWYRPHANPGGLIIAIPAQLFSLAGARLSVRQLIRAARLEPACVHCWSYGGLTYDAASGASPYLDQPLPAPNPGGNQNLVEIHVWMMPEMSSGWMAPMPATGYPGAPYGQALPPVGGGTELDQQLIAAIDSCWNGILQLEARVTSLRKELGSSLGRLNSLNRDLSIDERRACDSKDVQDWSDARRWLRDSVAVLARSVKEIDVGTTSGAGDRHKFEDIYRTQVASKIPWPGLAQTVHEFESYRKTLQNLVASAQSNLNKAGRDGEQRANSVLSRIGGKIRSMRRK